MLTNEPFQHFGTWIRATHRLEDLFPSLIELLEELERGGSLAEIPGDFCGDAVVINDHGNVSLYRAGIDGTGVQTLTEVWAVV